MSTRQPTPFGRQRIQRALSNRRLTRASNQRLYGLDASDLPWYCGVVQDGLPDDAGDRGPQKVAPEPLLMKWLNMSRTEAKTRPRQQVIIYSNTKDKSISLTSLFSHSSVPGLREISSSDHILRKIFWFIAFVMLSFFALSDIHLLLTEFYSYPITVDVRLRETRKLPFPAITVCNLNTVRYSALCNSTSNISIPIELKEKLCGAYGNYSQTNYSDINDINDINMAGGVTVPTTTSTTQEPDNGSGFGSGSEPDTGPTPGRIKRQSKNPSNGQARKPPRGQGQKPPNGQADKSNVPNQNGGNPKPTGENTNFIQVDEIELTEREEKELQENLTTWLAVMANVDKDLTLYLGHQFEDFVLRCTMKSNNCTDPRNFENSFTPSEGNCYTYKSFSYSGRGRNRKKPIETSLAGVDHGLELVLNLEVNEYLPGTSQVGAIVLVHDAEDFGIAASEAIFVSPERATYIGMKMVNISRLPAPYPERCVSQWPKDMIDSVAQNSSYSQQACLKICLQRTIQKKCRCQSAMLPQLETNSTDLRICDTRKRDTRKCVEEVMLRPENKIDICQCPPRCQVVQYEKTVSSAKWPTREDRVSFDRGKNNVNFQ
ncbi:Degenerin -like protein [Halotydeus destructor]|nr:Degenerin -like protein [Halotydeus destructor]